MMMDRQDSRSDLSDDGSILDSPYKDFKQYKDFCHYQEFLEFSKKFGKSGSR